MFDSIVSSVLSFILGSLFSAHTYVGIFLGACFAPVWVGVWNWLKALIIKKDPKAAVVVTEVQDVANAVVADITPVADIVKSETTPVV